MLPSFCCAVGVYFEVGIDHRNRYLYNVLHARYRDPWVNRVDGPDIEIAPT